MKKLLALLIVAAFAVPTFAAEEAPKTKQVCKDTIGKDNKPVKNKDGSVKQSCKTIKVHKKHDGTPVPEKKK
jgi:azurin